MKSLQKNFQTSAIFQKNRTAREVEPLKTSLLQRQYLSILQNSASSISYFAKEILA